MGPPGSTPPALSSNYPIGYERRGKRATKGGAWLPSPTIECRHGRPLLIGLRRHRIDHPLDHGDLAGGKAAPLGMFLDERFVVRDVDAERLVAREPATQEYSHYIFLFSAFISASTPFDFCDASRSASRSAEPIWGCLFRSPTSAWFYSGVLVSRNKAKHGAYDSEALARQTDALLPGGVAVRHAMI